MSRLREAMAGFSRQQILEALDGWQLMHSRFCQRALDPGACWMNLEPVSLLGKEITIHVPQCIRLWDCFNGRQLVELLADALGINFIHRKTLTKLLERRRRHGVWIDDLPYAYASAGLVVQRYYSLRDVVRLLPPAPKCRRCGARQRAHQWFSFTPVWCGQTFEYAYWCSKDCEYAGLDELIALGRRRQRPRRPPKISSVEAVVD